MRRFLSIACLLLASPVMGQEAPKRVEDPPRVDTYGDPLPAGALRRFGTTRFRQAFVDDIAFMPDGKSVVVQGADKVAQWDVATGRAMRTLSASSRNRRHMIGLSADGKFLVVRPDDRHVTIVDMTTGKGRFRADDDESCYFRVLSPDGSVLATGTEKGISLWNWHVGKDRRKLTQDNISSLRFSSDGKLLAGERIDRENFVILYDASTGAELGRVTALKPEDRPYGFDFTPDKRSLVVSWGLSGILVHDVATGKIARQIKENAQLLAISPDSKILAAIEGQYTILLIDLETGKEVRRWPLNERMVCVFRAAFSPDGKTLALPFECGIQLWDSATGKRIDPFREPIESIGDLAVSNDGKNIAAVYGYGGLLLLLDANTLKVKGRIEAEPVTLGDLSFSPDGRRLAFVDSPLDDQGKRSPRIRLMDVANGKECTPEKGIVGSFSHWRGSDSVVVTPTENSGAWIAVDAANGKELDRTPVPEHLFPPPLTPFWVRPGPIFVIGNDDGADESKARVFLAEWPSKKRVRRLVLQRRDAFLWGLSPDARVATSLDGGLSLWFSETWTGRDRFRLSSSCTWFEFSPDGRRIFIGGKRGRTIVDSLTFEPLIELGSGDAYAFSANGKFMVTGSASSLLVWDCTAPSLDRKTSGEKLSPARLEELWSDLRSDEAPVAHRAMIALARRPDDAVTFLRSRSTDRVPDEKTYDRLVRDLDDPQFKTREAAQIEIVRIAPFAGSLIRRTLKDPPSLETKRRLSKVLEKVELSEPDRVRWLRTCELLERIGTPQAQATLGVLRNHSELETSTDAARSLSERLGALGPIGSSFAETTPLPADSAAVGQRDDALEGQQAIGDVLTSKEKRDALRFITKYEATRRTGVDLVSPTGRFREYVQCIRRTIIHSVEGDDHGR